MKEMIMLNIKAAFDSVRYGFYELAYKHYVRKAKKSERKVIAYRDKKEPIFAYYEKLMKEILEG